MQKKNIVDTLAAKRFENSSCGTYNAPYKLEAVLSGLIIGIIGAIAIILFIIAVMIVRNNIHDQSTNTSLSTAVAVPLILIEAFLISVGIVAVRTIRNGYECSYIADETRFITNEGGNCRTIYYSEVQYIHFTRREFWGKFIGFDVTVVINNSQEEYSVVGHISEKTTPFYIIAERVEQIRRQQSRNQYIKQQVENMDENILHASAPPQTPTTPKSEIYSRLGQDAQMPALNIVNNLNISPPETESPAQESAPIEGGENTPDYYLDRHGHERFYDEILAQGRFKVVCRLKKTLILGITACALLLAAFFFYTSAENILAIIALAAAGVAAFLIFYGEECTYRANGHEFVVFHKKRGETHILYSDVQSVHYTGTPLGYKAHILTRYGMTTFTCLDARHGIYKKNELLPFYIIEQVIGNQI